VDADAAAEMGMGTRGALATAAVLAVLAGGCGKDERPEPLQAHSAQVAATLSWPGYAPLALITFRDAGGRRCHALGTLTADGPRVLGAAALPLSDALTRAQHCLDAGHRVLSLQSVPAADGAMRLVGGIASARVREIVVGDQRLKPRANGGFLALIPAGEPLGASVEVDFTGGDRRRFPLRAVLRTV
jgi:hypothetical protein